MKMPVAALAISPSVAHLGFHVEGLKILVSMVQFRPYPLSNLQSDFYSLIEFTSFAGSLSLP